MLSKGGSQKTDSAYGIYIYGTADTASGNIKEHHTEGKMTEINEGKNTMEQLPEDLRKRYEALKEKVTERREAWNALTAFIEAETDWLTAPASTRFHLCRKHGLLEHSVNVAETLLELKNLLAPELSDESCVVAALLHDLGKAGMPGNPQYLPSEPSDRQKAAADHITSITIWYT